MNDIPLIDAVPFMLEINAGAHSFEVANPRHYHEWRIWEDIKLPDDKILIPGLIGHATNYVEHPELIADYIVKYAGLVGRENVIAGADCGFSSRASYAPEVHPTVVWPKFQRAQRGSRPRHQAALALRFRPGSVDFGDELDLDRDVERQLGEADSGPRVLARSLAPDLDEQV